MTAFRYALPITVLAFATCSPALGCSPVLLKTANQIKADAQRSFREASAIVDAEVTAPMEFGRARKPGLTPIAYLKVLRVWKGTLTGTTIPVVYVSSCDIGLTRKGQRMRILLSGDGNGAMSADQLKNGAAAMLPGVFNTEIDRLLENRRPREFVDPGTEPPPRRSRVVGRVR